VNDATINESQAAPRATPAALSAGPARSTVLPRMELTGAVPTLVRDPRERFEAARELGRGAGGEVLLARDNDIDRPVAIKRLLPDLGDADSVARFVDEIRTLGGLDHPNIVPIHDVGITADGRYYYVMKYVEGETLAHVIARLAAGDPEYHRRYTYGARTRLFLQLLQGVHYAHARGVVHRDLKPANVMIGRFGEVVVMDWGIARNVRDGAERFPVADTAHTLSQPMPDASPLFRTTHGSLLGTPAYMSPEQARGEHDKVGPRSDVYALSVMFHELLTLRHYLADRRSIVECLAGVQRDDPPFAHFQSNPHQPAVPPDLSHFVRHGVAKDPARRYDSVAEMIDRLQRIEDGQCPVECPSTLLKRVGAGVSHAIDHRPLLVMGITALVGALSLLGVAGLVARVV
jgi:serine/threonine protein kinase